MTDSRDILDISGLDSVTCISTPATPRKRHFLSIWFRCCHVYGRLYRNASRTSYNGGCPRCGTRARALVRSDGTTRRCFQTVR
ncbi:MAG: hypothetical protein P8M22_09325 [Phycisphaerales bacterium]|nr:hypothetical protein [Phycisphaerales bacterium]